MPTERGVVVRGERPFGAGDAETDALGEFVLEAVPPGEEVELEVEYRERWPHARTTARPGAEGVVIVAPRPVRCVLPLEVEDHVRVEVEVVPESTSRYSSVGESRQYTFERVPGRYVISAHAAGHRPATRVIDLAADDDRPLQPLRLEAGGGSLALRVAWPATPITSIEMQYVDPSGARIRDWLDPPSAPTCRSTSGS